MLHLGITAVLINKKPGAEAGLSLLAMRQISVFCNDS